MQLFNVPFCGPEFSTFGNVFIYEPKQAVIQSLCKFEVTWSESSYYEISWWQSSVREHKKKSNKKLWTLFITFAWINSLQEKRNGSSISVSMDLMPIKRRDLQSNYLLSMLNHFNQKYLMADLGGQESRFSELCEDTSLIFLLVGINGLQRDILSKDFGRGEAELDLWSRCQGSRVLCRGSIFY